MEAARAAAESKFIGGSRRRSEQNVGAQEGKSFAPSSDPLLFDHSEYPVKSEKVDCSPFISDSPNRAPPPCFSSTTTFGDVHATVYPLSSRCVTPSSLQFAANAWPLTAKQMLTVITRKFNDAVEVKEAPQAADAPVGSWRPRSREQMHLASRKHWLCCDLSRRP